jgi:glycosyltransferase involved in cell wall biosynthesis
VGRYRQSCLAPNSLGIGPPRKSHLQIYLKLNSIAIRKRRKHQFQMKILHIITGLNSGGAELQLLRLIKNDKKNNHSVISLRGDGNIASKLREIAVPVYNLNLSLHTFPDGFLAALRLVGAQKPEVLSTWLHHADLFGSLLVLCGARAALVWNIRNSPIDKNWGIPMRAVFQITRLFSTVFPSAITFNSTTSMSQFLMLGYPKHKSVLIKNGFEPVDQAIMPRGHLNGFNFGVVSRWDPVKNHQVILDAVSDLHDCPGIRLLCFGRGMDQTNKTLMDKVSKVKKKVEIILRGEVRATDAIYEELDLMILASSSEGFSNVIVEALSRGVLVIATDVGDNREIVGNNGWIIPANDCDALIFAMTAAYDLKKQSPADWDRRRNEAATNARKGYRIETTVSEFNNVWGNLTKQ